MTVKYSLNKNEKLKSRKRIDELFATGKSFLVYPIKIVFLITDVIDQPFVKIGVSVSKKNFKLSVQRNRIKRLLRELYRLNKQPIIDFSNLKKKNIEIFFLYIDKEMPDFKELNSKMKVIINKLIQQIG